MGAASVLLLVVLIVVGQISPADMSNHSSGEPAVKYPADNKVVVIAAILTALSLITLIIVIVLCRYFKWCRKTSKKEQRSMGDEHIFGMDKQSTCFSFYTKEENLHSAIFTDIV